METWNETYRCRMFDLYVYYIYNRETGVSGRCETDDECFMNAQTIHEVVQSRLTLMLSAEVGGCGRTRVSLSLECI
jgi:hypothetical protein